MLRFFFIWGLFFVFSYSAYSETVTKDHNMFSSWTGFYAGLNAGIVKHTMNVTDLQATSFLSTIQEVSNPDFSGGLQVGYRRQLALDKLSGVYGLEGSINFPYTNFNQIYGSPFALYELNAQNKLNTIYLVQLTGGISAGKTLLFLAGGLSITDITGNMTSLDGAPFFNSFSVDKTAVGTVIGGGIEYAVTALFSARFKLDVISPNAYFTVDDTDNNFQVSNNIVQAVFGLNYKFG